MKSLSFEDWLMDYFGNEHPGYDYLLDDDIPDAFADWMSNIDSDTLIRLADLYGKEKYKEGKDAFIKGL
jgi:hypothetical protein